MLLRINLILTIFSIKIGNKIYYRDFTDTVFPISAEHATARI